MTENSMEAAVPHMESVFKCRTNHLCIKLPPKITEKWNITTTSEAEVYTRDLDDVREIMYRFKKAK